MGLAKKEESALVETLGVANEWIEKGYAIGKALKILGILHSTYYY